MGAMEWMEVLGIALLIAGFILVGVELMIPGFGVMGVSGIICLVLGIIVSADSVEDGLTVTIIVVVILAVMLTIAMVILKKFRPPFVLEENLKTETSYLSSQDLNYLIGKEGCASTDLRPCGKCRIEGVEFDVRTEGSYIQKGTKVFIQKIHENTIIVQER